MSENKFTPNSGNREKEKLSFKLWFKQKAIPGMAKVGNQRHLAAIRDSFGTMIPLIIAGSIGILVNAIVFGGAGSGYVSLLGLIAKTANPNLSWDAITSLLSDTSNGWGQTSKICGLAFGHMNTVTVGMMSIYFSFLFGYYIAISKGFSQTIIAGLVSVAGFMLASMGAINFFMDAKGLIGAIIFGLISTELFIKLSSVRALNIKLPDGVPPAVGKSFALFLPAVITLAIIGAANMIVLAPAIIGGKLVVTGNNQTLLGDNDEIIQALIDSLKLMSAEDIAKALNLNLADNAWIEEFRTNLANNQGFVDWYNSQSTSIQSMVAALFLNQGAGVGFGSFHSLDSNNILRFAVENGVIKVISGSYIGIVLTPDQFGWSAAIYQFFTSWFIGFATGKGGIGLAVVFVFFVGFFWFFGVHGSNLMAGIFEPIFWMILGINTSLVSSLGYQNAVDSGGMGVFTKPFFDSYMYVGGSGATLGLLVMTLAISKRRELKEVAKYATPAGVFQINEPVIFGYPLVLNPVYAIPFIFTPIINLVIGWLFSPAVLNVVKYSYVATPWTAPWFISAIITSLDVKAIIPATIIFGVDIMIYIPFVLLDNKLYFKKLKATNLEKYEEEKRYYGDKLYRFEVDTKTKVEALENKAEMVIFDAENIIDFWAKRQTNKDKFEKRRTDITLKAEAKKVEYLEKSKALQQKRDEKYKVLVAKQQSKAK